MDEPLKLKLDNLPPQFWLAALILRNHVINYDEAYHWADPLTHAYHEELLKAIDLVGDCIDVAINDDRLAERM